MISSIFERACHETICDVTTREGITLSNLVEVSSDNINVFLFGNKKCTFIQKRQNKFLTRLSSCVFTKTIWEMSFKGHIINCSVDFSVQSSSARSTVIPWSDGSGLCLH